MSDDAKIPTWEEIQATFPPQLLGGMAGIVSSYGTSGRALDESMLLILHFLEMAYLAGENAGIRAAQDLFDTAMEKTFGPASSEAALIKMEVKGPTQ